MKSFHKNFMKPVSTQSALAAAVKAARAAGKIMRDNWHRPKRVNSAEAHDIKLELDVRCQKLIAKMLHTAFPKISLLGEEGDSGDESSEYRWVVDPIDGTVNYFFGMPHAAVSIALQIRSGGWRVASGKKWRTQLPATRHASHVTLLGVIYDPFADELWTTTLGGKTKLNGRVVRVSKRGKPGEAVVAMGFSKSKENLEKSLPHLVRLARSTLKIRIMGSAALELAYVASGRLDLYVERTINLWDIAAGALMVENSGGECWTRPAPNGKLRMCADNGKLRKKLGLDSLLR
jgi:myo-inositol-1(or 4)-monophosphatase